MTGNYARRVAPFGDLRINACSAALRSLSQLYHVLHRLLVPRHPPKALISLTFRSPYLHPNALFTSAQNSSTALNTLRYPVFKEPRWGCPAGRVGGGPPSAPAEIASGGGGCQRLSLRSQHRGRTTSIDSDYMSEKRALASLPGPSPSGRPRVVARPLSRRCRDDGGDRRPPRSKDSGHVGASSSSEHPIG